MKHVLKLGIIVMTILVSGCLSPKALPNEKKLFIENNRTSFYIINSIPNSERKSSPHFCLLMVANIKDKKQSLQYYASIYNPYDTSFTPYHSYTDGLTMDTSYQFPITSIVESNDSSEVLKWNWKLHRNKLNLEASDKRASLRFNAKFKKQLPFVINQVKQQPAIFCVSPISAQSALNEQIWLKYRSSLFISIVQNGEELLKKYANHYLIWINWTLKNGETTTQCLTLNAEGKTSSVFENERELVFSLPKENNKAFWISNVTSKKYPLYWEVKNSKSNATYLLNPSVVNQELNFKNNSFWMGAINIVNADDKELIGKGNMYILKL